MKLLVDLVKADPIGTQGVDTLPALSVGTEFERASDRVGDGRRGFGSWIGEGLLAVAVALRRVDEGRARG